ncbi:hypothetical protein NEMBOFW57_010059 [Staphylotrichum longicolle]|uniref:Nulp1-pending protein n=1 Tax=Staphylotrichum longicolle TaxID=669026 RepID=A0AAD4EQ37_9PEZI|nr:hypothetical protein NEMBOFW57_010059 [Staphylotrichum longicolle]
MASRQLRKLRKQQELLNLQTETADKSEESEDEPIVVKPRANMFSGFAALGDAGDEADDDDEEDQKSEAEDAQPAAPRDDQPDVQPEPAKKSKKKSKKKKKKGMQPEQPAPAQDDHESIDEIDRVLEELKLERQQPGGGDMIPPKAGESAAGLDELLRINFQHLKAMNEMRRVFGRAMDVAEVEERAQGTRTQPLLDNMDLETFLSARAARPGQGPQGNKSMFDTILRTNPFIDGKKTWPRGTAQGLKMIRLTESPGGEVEFSFAHDNAYDALEGSFFGLVQMYDPMQIVYFLHKHPYHISSLIQVGKVALQDQNSALAADLIERALFTFGRATLSEFRKKLEKGQARMSFARPENRQFYLAGYNLIQKLVLKGTYRTALEWAKLFLSINHSDPYDMLNWIHVLAIRAREAQWFVDLCNSDLFHNAELSTRIYPYQTLPLAHFQLNNHDAAQSALVKGMETLPWLFCALFSALNIDTPKSLWAVQPRDDDEALRTQLYLHMAKDLWNTPQHITLLKSAAAAATRVDDPSTALPRGPPVALPTARFIYLDNNPALMSAVPRGMLHAASPNFDFDPLPPPKGDNVFSSQTQQLPWTTVEATRAAARGGGAGGGAGAVMEAAVARLQAEIQREVEERIVQRRREVRQILGEERARDQGWGWSDEDGEGEGEGQGAGQEGEGGAQPQQQEEQEQEQRERRFLPGPPAPGIMNYLRYLMEDRLEVVDQLEEFEAPTGMPGGWGQGEGWEEEVDDWGQDDFEGQDAFEGADDFEGGEREGEEPERR